MPPKTILFFGGLFFLQTIRNSDKNSQTLSIRSTKEKAKKSRNQNIYKGTDGHVSPTFQNIHRQLIYNDIPVFYSFQQGVEKKQKKKVGKCGEFRNFEA